MAKDFEIFGDKALLHTMQMLGDRATRDILKPAVSKALTPVNREAKRLAPVLNKNLRKSLGKRVKARKDKVVGKITVRKGFAGAAKYAHMQEFGTKYQAAKPFMRAALYNKRHQVQQIMADETKKNLEKQVSKAVGAGLFRRTSLGGLRRLI